MSGDTPLFTPTTGTMGSRVPPGTQQRRGPRGTFARAQSPPTLATGRSIPPHNARAGHVFPEHIQDRVSGPLLRLTGGAPEKTPLFLPQLQSPPRCLRRLRRDPRVAYFLIAQGSALSLA